MIILTEDIAYLSLPLAILVVLIAGAIFNVAVASEQSSELVVQGIDELKRHSYEDALKKFDSAAVADADDRRPLFFKAVALNRMGRFGASRNLLAGLKEKGFEHPDFNFEFGWSLMGMKSWQEALSAFESYEKSRPGRGQTMEFIGRCYFALGQLDMAKSTLNEALARDPRLKTTVEFYLALLERKLSNDEAAVKHLTAVFDSDSELGQALREMTGAPPAQVAEPNNQKKIGVVASAVTGYNDNVIGFGKAITLPADITHKDSFFERFSVNLSYRAQKADSGAAVGYAFLADTYNDMPKVNLVDNYFYADYFRALSEKIFSSVRVSDEYTFSGGHRFRNQIGLRPALSYRFTAGSVTEFSYGYSKSDYLFNNAVAAWNRDGHADTATVTHYFIFSGKSSGNIAFLHGWNHSDGSDFAFQSDKFLARLSYLLYKGITGEGAFTYSKDRYDNPNSLSPQGVNRNDRAENFSAQIKKAVNKDINLFIQYNGTRTHSNIQFYSFNQNVWSVGVSVTR